MDRETGEMKLTRGVRDRLTTPEAYLQVMVRLMCTVKLDRYRPHCLTPTFSLTTLHSFSFSVSCTQAYQDNDPRKYSVATVLVRVLAVNLFHPEFDMPEYHGFVTAEKSAASLVNTYGSKALMLHVLDRDFKQVCTVTRTHLYSPPTVLAKMHLFLVTRHLLFL